MDGSARAALTARLAQSRLALLLYGAIVAAMALAICAAHGRPPATVLVAVALKLTLH